MRPCHYVAAVASAIKLQPEHTSQVLSTCCDPADEGSGSQCLTGVLEACHKVEVMLHQLCAQILATACCNRGRPELTVSSCSMFHLL